MYKKISKKYIFNPKKNHFFYESVFSKTGIKHVKSIIPKDYKIIEFLIDQNSLPVFECEKIYLDHSLSDIIYILKNLNKKDSYAFINIPIELHKYINVKRFFIYSSNFPSEGYLNDLGLPILIIGRNFTNEEQSNPLNEKFQAYKYNPITKINIIELFFSIIVILFFIYLYFAEIYGKTIPYTKVW